MSAASDLDSAPKRYLKTGQAVKGRQQKLNGESPIVQIVVRDNNVDQALKALKKKMQREGLFREMKRRNHFEKPSLCLELDYLFLALKVMLCSLVFD